MTAPAGTPGTQTSTASRSGWTEWVYLAYLSILVFQPFGSPDARAADWLIVVIIVALFVPMYAAGVLRPDSQRWLIGPTVVLGIAAVPFNSGATVLFVYAAAFAAETQSRRATIRWLGALTLLIVALSLVSAVPMPWRLFSFVPAGIFVWVVGVTVLKDAEERRAARGLRVENARIEHLATVTERERIARDLHDLLGHTLSVITLKSELAAKLAARDPLRAAQEMREVERTSRQALKEVREAVRGFRARGFMAELTNAKLALEAAGVRFEYYAEPVALTPTQESTLALALREAVTNVVRHAQATRCAVRLVQDKEGVRLEVCDDGRGILRPEGSGLTGMRERVAALGGKLEIDGSQGTRLLVRLPQGTGHAAEVPAPELQLEAT